MILFVFSYSSIIFQLEIPKAHQLFSLIEGSETS